MPSTIYPYGTHVLPLIRCLEETDGDVLEFGSGPISTPLLNALCLPSEGAKKREILTLEEDQKWAVLARQYDSAYHKVAHVPDLSKVLPHMNSKDFSVVLIDNGDAGDNEETTREKRMRLLPWAVEATSIVLHDAGVLKINELKKLKDLYKFMYVYDRIFPSTLVLSNVEDVREWFKERKD